MVWLPEGERPDSDDFDPREDLSPPHPNPEPWWHIYEAIIYAYDTVAHGRNHEKLPWIKFGDELLSPDEIIEIYENLPANWK